MNQPVSDAAQAVKANKDVEVVPAKTAKLKPESLNNHAVDAHPKKKGNA